MKCVSCQFNNPEGMNFCGKCGSPLNISCPQCGHQNPAGLQFCEKCETRLSRKAAVPAYARRSPMDYTPPFLAERALKVASALVGERKLVSVLFADVVNFTRIAEKLDPEDVHIIMDGCFELLGQEIHGAGGTINQYTGDGIMALFGAPIAYDEHIRPACRAALQIQRRMRRYHQKIISRYGVSFKLRIGIHTGPVVVGAIGDNLRLDYTAVGDTTNLAARLQSLARPGEILTSKRVHRGAENRFLFKDAGQLSIKGKQEPVQAFILVKELAGKYTEKESGSIGIPFIGRSKETVLLKKAFEDAIENGPTIAAVTGEAGIGKTRLLNHFRRSLKDESVLFLKGRCMPYGQSVGLYTLNQMLRSYFNLSEQDSYEKVRSKVQRRLKEFAVSPLLDSLLDLFPEVIKRRQTSQMIVKGKKRALFRAIRDLLVAISSVKPVIIVVNDMQWVDASTREFLTFFCNSSRKASVLLLCIGRPEASSLLPDVPLHHVRLKPLSEKEALELFSAVLETEYFDPKVCRKIVASAGGNPLFLVEIGETLKRQGLIVRDDLRCTLKVPLNEIKTPDSIQGVLAARLDALAPEQKNLLQLAAVIGREFSKNLLQTLIALRGDLSESLEALAKEGIIARISCVEEDCYQFRQQIMQEVAYHNILLRERRQYHRTVGEAIEIMHQRNLPAKMDLLAHHFYEAQDWSKALGYTLEAAEKASYSFACQEAITSIDRALDILLKGQWKQVGLKNLDLYKRKGKMHFCVGQLEAAQKAFTSMLAEARRLGEREEEAEALFRLGWNAFYRHQPRIAQSRLKSAVNLSKRGGFPEVLLKATGFLGFVYAVLGRLKEAGYMLTEAFHLGEKLGAVEGKAWSLVNLVRYYNWIGQFEEALELSRQLGVLNHEIRSPYLKILLHFSQGSIYGALGQIEEAKKSLKAGLRHLEAGDDSFWRPRFLNTLGWVHAEAGEFQDAVRLNKQSLKEALRTGDPEIIHNSQINLGENYLALDNLEKAQDILAKTWQEVKKPGVSYTRWRYKTRLLIAMGELHGRLNDYKKGLYFVRKAINLAQKNGAKKHHARALLIRAQLLSRTRLGLAQQSLEKAIALSREMKTRILSERILRAQKEINSSELPPV